MVLLCLENKDQLSFVLSFFLLYHESYYSDYSYGFAERNILCCLFIASKGI